MLRFSPNKQNRRHRRAILVVLVQASLTHRSAVTGANEAGDRALRPRLRNQGTAQVPADVTLGRTLRGGN